jgi:hypothetical protein
LLPKVPCRKNVILLKLLILESVVETLNIISLLIKDLECRLHTLSLTHTHTHTYIVSLSLSLNIYTHTHITHTHTHICARTQTHTLFIVHTPNMQVYSTHTIHRHLYIAKFYLWNRLFLGCSEPLCLQNTLRDSALGLLSGCVQTFNSTFYKLLPSNSIPEDLSS